MATTSRRRSRTPARKKPKKKEVRVTEDPKEVPAPPKSHSSLINSIGALTIGLWAFASIAILAKDVRDADDAKIGNPYWPWTSGDEWVRGMAVVTAAILAFYSVHSHKDSTTKRRLLFVPVALCLPVLIYKLDLHHLLSFLGCVIFIAAMVVCATVLDWDDGWTIWRMYFDDEMGLDAHDDRRRAKRGSAKRGGGKGAGGSLVWGGGWWLGFRVVNWAIGCSFMLCAMCTLYEEMADHVLTLWQLEYLSRRQWCFVSIVYLSSAFIVTSIATKGD